jgi:hypothetical protein
MNKSEEEVEIGRLKGQKKVFYYPLLIVSGAMVLIAAAIVYLILFLPNTTQDVRSERKEEPLASVVSNLNIQLRNSFTSLQLRNTPDPSNSNGYQLTGYDFGVLLPVGSNSLSYEDKTTSNESTTYSYLSQTLSNISNYFDKHGFSLPSHQSKPGSILNSVNFYERKDAICQVTIYTLLDITCADKTTIASIASTDAPLIALYEVAKPGVGENSAGAPLQIKSFTNGYNLASLNIFNDAGETKVNYYIQDTSTDAKWQMVNLDWYNDPHEDGDITPNCQDLESNSQTRLAYLGQACYDSSSEAPATID